MVLQLKVLRAYSQMDGHLSSVQSRGRMCPAGREEYRNHVQVRVFCSPDNEEPTELTVSSQSTTKFKRLSKISWKRGVGEMQKKRSKYFCRANETISGTK